jgi:uncharacterized membrane protein
VAFPKSTASIAGHPIHPMLVPFPIAFFVGALLTDIAYVKWSGMWAYASTWLIGAGIVSALLAAIFGFIDFFGEKPIRNLRVAWFHMIGNLVVVLLSAWNLLIHNRDGAISVIPTGITLSAIVAGLLIMTGWLGGHMVYRHGVAVRPLDDADQIDT